MADVDQALLSDLERFGSAFALDMETALVPLCWEGRQQQRLLQLYNDSCSAWYDLKLWGEPQWEALRVWLENPELEVYGHNLGFDVKCLLASGVEVRGRLYDTMIASRLIHQGTANIRHSLGDVVRRELGKVIDKSLQSQDWMNAELSEADLAYAMTDVKMTWDAAHSLHAQVFEQGLLHTYQLETALIPVVAAMELKGMYVDTEQLRSAREFYCSSRNEGQVFYVQLLDEQLKEKGHEGLPRLASGEVNLNAKATGKVREGTKVPAGFNMGSPLQHAAYWGVLGIVPKDDKGKVSLDKKNLATYRHHEIVRTYEFYKKAEKRATMAEKLIEHVRGDGRIHAQFMPLQTATGRWSCSNPNLQQIPRDPEFRTAFTAPEGHVLVQADYSAMELRYLAAVAECAPMLDAFNSGADLHTRTAALMYGIADEEVEKPQRTAAKACNFGLAYASAPKGLQSYFATLGLYIKPKEARDFYEMWHAAYPEVGKWHRWCQKQVDAGAPVRTAIGRRRKLYGEENRVQIFANNTIQGGCADIMKAAMVSIFHQLPAGAQLVACVHDEVLCESRIEAADEVLGIVVGEMQDAAIPIVGTAVTMKAEGGVVCSWGEK
jgi:DNA polymerase I-like protein with 3'-5' exonuclease and polymerase domains